MGEVVVIAVVHAAAGARDAVESLVREQLIPGTHAEEGCITFALHRDTRDPDRLVIIECWADGAALGAHLETPHLAAFRAAVAPLSAAPADVYVLEGVAAGDAIKGVLGAAGG